MCRKPHDEIPCSCHHRPRCRGVTTSAAEFCGTNSDSGVNAGVYSVYNNHWGEDTVSATQCTEVDSSEGTSIAWHTRYNATGGNPSHYKSFAAAALNFNSVQISSIKSIPTTINYNYTSDGDMVSNVAYDMFTSWTPAGHPNNEVMVWLAAYGGATPKSTSGQPIKTATLSGVEFDLYQGYNQNFVVYTYVAKQPVTSFKGDLKPFFNELPSNDPTQYLQVLQAGTQAFQGTNAKLTVSNLNLNIL
ncbi:unnamed protein product [Phytophthora lilii]|uniref:Unnamed protein product n=1 Tax=Phytophthora lilii TaxID=2077276 RepID=A0A9W6XHD3_9STRA|nr:unnamed protein product [Phytophthora lilii]